MMIDSLMVQEKNEFSVSNKCAFVKKPHPPEGMKFLLD